MPLYEYECTACHRRTEKIQKFSDAELTVCPHCGGALERTITAPAIQFKGAGWYKDLYSSAKPAAAGGDGGAAPSGGESTGEAKQDKGEAAAAASGAKAEPGAKAASGASTSAAPASAPAAPTAPSSGS